MMSSRKAETNNSCTFLSASSSSLLIAIIHPLFLTVYVLSRGIYSSMIAFLAFSLIQFRDGPFVRPHPAFWRVVLGINLLYELGLVFLLFQDLDSARVMMKYLDPSLGVPLPEKSYGDDCTLSLKTLWVGLF